jgi:adenylate cyclase class IV
MTEKEFKRIPWNEYKEILERLGYSEEQIIEVEKTRESLDYMSAEQFRFLFLSGLVKRLVKVKKPRCYYTDEEDIFYLNHYNKSFEKAGFFINE